MISRDSPERATTRRFSAGDRANPSIDAGPVDVVVGGLEEIRAAFLAADKIGQRGRSTFLDPDYPTFRNSAAYLVIQVAQAAKRLPEQYREQHSRVDWKSLIGIRDRAAHYTVNYDFRYVWETITRDFTLLSGELQLGE